MQRLPSYTLLLIHEALLVRDVSLLGLLQNRLFTLTALAFRTLAWRNYTCRRPCLFHHLLTIPALLTVAICLLSVLEDLS